MTTAESTEKAGNAAPDTFLGHPKGLFFLFFTEMWERFSYYGMRALLVLYMLKHLEWQPEDSSSVYKWYTSLVYLTPLLGGFIADRFLGLRLSIVIGSVLMAAGQFLLAFEPLPFFYGGLGLLVAGNGFFKPNISTMVGKMYKQGDSRRDGAFTIFYMGINLGAFLAPFVCGYMRQHVGPHAGFVAAGVGMLVGMGVFLAGQNRVQADIRAAGNDVVVAAKKDAAEAQAKADEEKKVEEEKKHGPYRAGASPDEEGEMPSGAAGGVTRAFPFIMIVGAITIALMQIVKVAQHTAKPISLIMPVAFGGVFIWMAITLLSIKGRSRAKSSVIFVLFMAAVIFWMAFEQAGNALNIWADQHTDLHIGSFEYPAEWFQSVNAVFIVILAPVFSMLWIWLGKKGKEPPTPLKMVLALVLVGLSFLAMVGAAVSENTTVTSVPLESLPPGLDVSKLNAGRMRYDAAGKKLEVRGVLPLFAVTDALAKTVDPAYDKQIKDLEDASSSATDKRPVTAKIGPLPAGFSFPMDEEEAKKLELEVKDHVAKNKTMTVEWNDKEATVTLTTALSASARTNLVGGGAPREWRETVRKLEKASQGARVSGLWLLLSYLIATLGELCLSPVGLSMVTKLAPARFASLFMGVWLLASSVAQYIGGSIGESWGKVAPVDYFMLFVYASAAAVVLLALLVKPLRTMMHDVR
jgi:POT family proton-dependent oligopeptide transporter